MEEPRVPPSEECTFRVEAATRWSDEDTQGVLNHAVYLTLCEEARHALFSARGALIDNRFPFVLARALTAWRAPGRGGAPVVVEGATTHVGRTSFAQAYRVRDRTSGRTLFEAEMLLVCTDPATGRPAEIPAAMRAALA